MALEFTDASVKQHIESGNIVVVDFWAEWCGPCRMLSPTIDELAQDYEGKAVIGKLNVDNHSETPETYGIRNIPTLLFFKGGKLVDKHVGVAPKNVLAGKIDALL